MEGGDVQVWGLRVPSQPCLSISCANPKFLSLCCVLGLGTDAEVASPARCATAPCSPFAPRKGPGGFFRDAPGHGDGGTGVLRLWLLFKRLQKDFLKSYSFFPHGFACLPLEEGMPQELGRAAREDFQRWKS